MMKAIMATVKQPDRETLEQDLQVMMANKQTAPVIRGPRPEPGVKLGKRRVSPPVMHGGPDGSAG